MNGTEDDDQSLSPIIGFSTICQAQLKDCSGASRKLFDHDDEVGSNSSSAPHNRETLVEGTLN